MARLTVNLFRVLLLISLSVVFTLSAWAQEDDDDEFFESEDGYEEPFDEPTGEAPVDNSGPPIPGPPKPTPFNPSIPPPSSGSSGFGGAPPINRFNNRKNNKVSGNTLGTSGEIEFKLVDPPKYWKPKKRRRAANP